MTIWSIRTMNGQIPRVAKDRLPDGYAASATNCDFSADELAPLRGLGTKYSVAEAAQPLRGLFTSDGLAFYAWNKPTRAYLHPTIDDTHGRVIYHTHGAGLKVAQLSGMNPMGMLPGPPATAWDVGVSAPSAPVVSLAGKDVVAGQGVFAVSTDGINWSASSTAPLGTATITAYVAAGTTDVAFDAAGNAAHSTDGVHWDKSPVKPLSGGAAVRDAAYLGGTVVAVGASGQLSTSLDNGGSWIIRPSGVTEDLIVALAGAGLFVVAGAGGKLLTSPDGEAWTPRDSTFGTANIEGVEFLASRFLAFGAMGKLATSTDGMAWTSTSSSFGLSTIRAVGRSASKWLIAGDAGKVANSSDGTLWIERATPFGGTTVLGIVGAGAVVLAFDTVGSLARSADDGDSWSPVAFSSGKVSALARIGGLWVITTSAGIYSSSDGSAWVRRADAAYVSLVLSATGRAYVAGDYTATDAMSSVAVVAVAVNLWGEESAPSPVASYEVADGQSATYAVTYATTAGQQSVSGILFYRTYPGQTDDSYFLISETPAPIVGGVATFKDETTEPATASKLYSASWELPPSNIANLTYAGNGFFAASVGKDLLFSEPYKPHAWPYRMTLPYVVVGVIAVEGGVLATTTAGVAYLVAGAHPQQLGQQLIPTEQAGWSDTSMVRVSGATVYASNDGLVRIYGGQPSLKESQALFRRSDWRQFYGARRLNLRLAHHDGQLLGITDPSYPIAAAMPPFIVRLDDGSGAFCSLDLGESVFGAVASESTDQLFVMLATGFAEFATGGALTLSWTSGDKLYPLPVNFAAGVVDASSTAALEVWADGALRHTVAVAGRTSFRLPPGAPAYRWSVKITGSSVVREISLGTSFRELKDA